MPTLRDGKTERFYLYAGFQCTVTTDAAGSALVTRFSENGTDKLDNVLLSNSGSVTLGEYFGAIIVQIDCLTGIANFNITQSTTAASSGGGGGFDKLISATITTPVSYVDFKLANGYDSFQFSVVGVKFSAVDALAAAVSLDGGTTFLNASYTYGQAHSSDTSWPVFTNGVDTIMNPIILAYGYDPGNGIMDIFPGDANSKASIFDISAFRVSSGVSFGFGANYSPSNGRITDIRLQPYGNGDTPPTSAHTLVSGAFILYGRGG